MNELWRKDDEEYFSNIPFPLVLLSLATPKTLKVTKLLCLLLG